MGAPPTVATGLPPGILPGVTPRECTCWYHWYHEGAPQGIPRAYLPEGSTCETWGCREPQVSHSASPGPLGGAPPVRQKEYLAPEVPAPNARWYPRAGSFGGVPGGTPRAPLMVPASILPGSIFLEVFFPGVLPGSSLAALPGKGNPGGTPALPGGVLLGVSPGVSRWQPYHI